MRSSFLLALCATVSVAVAIPAPETAIAKRETAVQATDRLLFSSTISQFITARNAKNPSTLDWSSDGCSDSPDNPGYNFLPCCYRHDFGYRNYKKQNRFTDANKDRIDSNFRNDMYNVCAAETNSASEDICRGIADVYYWAVHTFGSKRDLSEEALNARACAAASN